MSPQLQIVPLNSKLPFEANKWLELRFLIDPEEMQLLLEELSPFGIYLANGVSPLGAGTISQEEFLTCYTDYIEALKAGKIPDNKAYRAQFSSSWTVAADHLYAVPVGENQQLIRIEKPVLQLQAHCMDYSDADDTFRSMVYGRDSILWGLQCSYPQIYQNHITHEIDKVVESPDFPNTGLFRRLQQWLRVHTMPTPFVVGEGDKAHRINSPMRIGKRSLSWINDHPQLIARGIKVHSLKN